LYEFSCGKGKDAKPLYGGMVQYYVDDKVDYESYFLYKTKCNYDRRLSGDTVPLYYDPAQHRDIPSDDDFYDKTRTRTSSAVREDNFLSLWFYPMLCIILSAIFGFVGVVKFLSDQGINCGNDTDDEQETQNDEENTFDDQANGGGGNQRIRMQSLSTSYNLSQNQQLENLCRIKT